MAGKLSFSIAINLLTENFKKGTSTVKNSLRSMQAQILTFAAALGFAGVSLSNLISEIIRVARETSKATTALKNVSGSTVRFAENLRFTTSLAKKYGVYVNDITANFAKFTAAASIAGMKMEDQRKLFESLSRAATGFGLSADESNGMFLAVTQMMGKGKIQAEELRGQLGERLPIAMQAMAKAAGTTVAGLDKIMKEGKLLSAEVLPKFADALNEMLPNVDTDNIETSLNRLKNAFQQFTETTGVQGFYKKLIDGLTNFVDYAQGKLSSLATFIILLVSGKLLSNVMSFFKQQHSILNSSVKAYERAEMRKTDATEKRVKAAALAEATQKDYETIVNGQRMASEVELQKAKNALQTAKKNERNAILAAEVAAEKAASIKSMSVWQKTGSIIIATGKRISIALKAVWSTVWPMALVTAISAVVTKLIDMYQEAKRVRNIFNDYKKSVSNISSPVEKSQLEALKSIAEDTTRSTKERISAWEELANRMNLVQNKNETELEFHKRINTEIAKRIKLLENTARADLYATRKIEAEDKFKAIQKELGIQNMNPMGTEYLMQQISLYGKTGSKKAQVDGLQRYYREVWDTNGKFVEGYENKLIEMSGYWEVMADATKEMEKATAGLLENKPKETSTLTSNTDTKKTDLQKEEEKYANSLRELTNKLNNRAISEEEYKAQLNDLNKATYNTLSGMLTPEEAAKNKTYQTVKTFSVSSEFSEAEANYRTELGKYSNLLKNGAINEEEYQKAKLDLLQSTIKAIASLDNLSEMEKTYLTGMLSEAQNLQSSIIKRPELKTYDTTFDYKKSDTDIYAGQLAVAKENLEKIKEAYNNGAKDLIDELNNAFNNVTTLEDALKIAEVKKDVKDLTRQLNEGIYSGVKDIASSSDRLVSAFSSLRGVMNDEDATAWERIMAVWNAMTNTVDAFMSIVKMIETLTEVTQKLAKAKQVEASIDTATTTTKVTNATTEAAAEVTAAGTSIIADETASAVKKKTATQNVAASTAEGAADAGKSAAKLPFPWNIVAIGGAIAAAIAAFAMIPKFAGGGIVQGSTSGDKNLARVNGGEMILNGRQQATLFQIANGKGLAGREIRVVGETFVAGDKLKIVLRNTDQKQRRGR